MPKLPVYFPPFMFFNEFDGAIIRFCKAAHEESKWALGK